MRPSVPLLTACALLSSTSAVPSSSCDVKLITLLSKPCALKFGGCNCTLDVTFGCFPNGSMWSRDGCHGIFECDGVNAIWCFGGGRPDNPPTVCPCKCLPPHCIPAPAAFRFAQIYSDSMVLQREPNSASIWGFSAPNDHITVAVSGTSIKATAAANAQGRWRLSLPPQPASTSPVTVTASNSAGSTITIKDVLFGDVWLCSGKFACNVAWHPHCSYT